MPDWSLIASLSTAAGTLVLGVATFASVRSSNRYARIAERALLIGMRPVLAPTRLDDPPQKVGFVDGRWLVVPGGRGLAEVTDEAAYFAIAVRNTGSGIAVLIGWDLVIDKPPMEPHRDPARFHRLTRDLYIAGGDAGFWQGALRDPASEEFAAIRPIIEAHGPIVVDVLYGDQDGGQRTISRFRMTPYQDGWIAVVGRHWNLDRPDPRIG